MSILSLFKSKSSRELEAKIRFRRSKTKVLSYVQEASKSSERYWLLAREAYRLGDDGQFRLIGAQYIRLQDTITRWKRFMVKLEALELRRNEVVATKDFMLSMNELSTSMSRGASPQEIAKMQLEIERAIEKANAQEQMLDVAMEAAGTCLLGNLDDMKILSELETSIAGSLHIEPRRDTKTRTAKLDDKVTHALERLSEDSARKGQNSFTG